LKCRSAVPPHREAQEAGRQRPHIQTSDTSKIVASLQHLLSPLIVVEELMPQINEVSEKLAPQCFPGYLMMPFGWAAKPLAVILEADRSLYSALFTLSRHRMHLIALALAHWPGEIEASFARLLMLGAPGMVVDAVLGRRPAGLKRAFSRLPVRVLPQASYRQLVILFGIETLRMAWSSGSVCVPWAFGTSRLLPDRRGRTRTSRD
jgi:hypothetical protein